MFKKLSLVLAVLLTGCTVTIEKPVMTAPPPPMCDMMIGGKCKSMTASEKSGATSLGNKIDEDQP
jgi:hypothetical protein